MNKNVWIWMIGIIILLPIVFSVIIRPEIYYPFDSNFSMVDNSSYAEGTKEGTPSIINYDKMRGNGSAYLQADGIQYQLLEFNKNVTVIFWIKYNHTYTSYDPSFLSGTKSVYDDCSTQAMCQGAGVTGTTASWNLTAGRYSPATSNQMTPENAWFCVGITWTGNQNLTLYYNGIYNTSSPSNNLPDWRYFRIGGTEYSSQPIDNMLIDDFKLFQRKLTTAQIQMACNGGDVIDNTITLWNYTPLNNTQYNTNPIEFAVNATSELDFNCSLYLNNQLNETKIYGNGTNIIINFTKILNDGIWNHSISCFSNESMVNTTTNWFWIDTIKSNITTNYTNNTNYQWSNNNISIHFNLSDENLIYSYNLSLNGALIGNQTNIGIPFFTANTTINISLLKIGNNNLHIRVADGHTDNELKSIYTYSTGIFEDYLKYTINGKKYVKIQSTTSSIFDKWTTKKLKDRYTFTYQPNEIKSDYEYTIESDMEISVLNNEKYGQWIVLDGKYWMDFIIPNEENTAIITKTGKTTAKVKMTGIKKPSNQTFNSIGELNVEERDYNIILSPIGNYLKIHARDINENLFTTTTIWENITGTSQATNPFINLIGYYLNDTYQNNTIKVIITETSGYYNTLNTTIYANATNVEFNLSLTPKTMFIGFINTTGSYTATSGYITDGNKVTTFNSTNNVSIAGLNFSFTKIKVYFGNISQGNYTQFYEFTNDGTSSDTKNITIIANPSKEVWFQVLDTSSNYIGDAIVRTSQSIPTEGATKYYNLVGQRFTNNDGTIKFYLDPTTDVFLTIIKDGYTLSMNITMAVSQFSTSEGYPYKIYLTTSSNPVYGGTMLAIKNQITTEDKTNGIRGWVLSEGATTINYITDTREALGLGQGTVSLNNADIGMFTLNQGIDYIAGNSSIILYLYRDGVNVINTTIRFWTPTTSKWKEPTGLSNEIKDPLIFIGLIITSGIGGILFKKSSEDEGGGDTGKTIFLIGSIVLAFIQQSIFIYIAIIAILGYAIGALKAPTTQE